MRKGSLPSLCKRVDRGREYAAVTLTDSKTKRRRTYRLGGYATDESRERYLQLLTDWQRRGRRLPDSPRQDNQPGNAITITQLCHAYWAVTRGRYSRSHESNLDAAVRLLRQFHGATAVDAFGPNALRLIREAMIRGDANAKPKPRRPWSRSVANRFTRQIVAIFKWGVAHEMVPPAIHQALRTIEPLKRGQTTAHEPKPVRPVPDVHVDAALEHMRPQVRAMVELQRCTGMRSGEVVIMRTRDIDVSGTIWVYSPAQHKTLVHGHDRRVYLGPRAQEILRPWLRPSLDECLFQPREAVADQLAERHAKRETPLHYGNQPGTNRKASRKYPPGERYTTDSYRKAVVRACDLADRAAKQKAAKEGRKVPDDERLVPRWHPHQLRHSHATAVRKQFGIEAARIALGHQHVDVTEIYAERDQAIAEKIARTVG